MKKLAAVLVALVVVAFPAMASAQGGSGIDEYSEDVPGGGGGTPSNDGNGGGAPLPNSSQEALQEQGTDGAAAAELAESTGPGNGSGGGGDGGGSGSGPGSGSGSGDSSANPASTGGGDSSGSGIDDVVVELAGGSEDGMGILLPIILGSVLVAAVAFVLIRRGGGSPGSA